jgi:uncharacterized protein (TIGR03437 family)
LTVSNGSQTTTPFSITVNATGPSVLILPPTNTQFQYLGAVFPDFMTYVLPPGFTTAVPTRRARAGDTIVLFGMGLGPVSQNVPDGQAAPPGIAMQTLPSVSFNGTPAQVSSAGLVPGVIGLYQINVVVPQIAMPAGQTFDDTVHVAVVVNGVTLSWIAAPLVLPVEQ